MSVIDRNGVVISAANPPSSSTPTADLAIKTACLVATTGANIVLVGVQTVDGVSVGNGAERVLVKDQSDLTQNGPYNASTGNWTRVIDANNNTQLASGCAVFVTNGVINAKSQWNLSDTDPVVLGTTQLTFLRSLATPTLTRAWPVLGTPGSNFNVVTATGVAVPTANSPTQGLQEAVNAALTPLGTAGADLDIEGADNPTGGATTAQLSTTLAFPATQGKRVRIGSVTLNTNSNVGANPGITFDSQEMMEFELKGGQHVYQGTSAGSAILFKPINGTPLDHGISIFDSSFWFTAPAAIAFDWSGHAGANGAQCNYFDFGELNYSDAQHGTAAGGPFFVPSVGGGQNFCYNMFRSRHVHGVVGSGTVWKVGNGAPAGGQFFGRNMYQLNLTPDSSTGATGIDTWESNSFYLVNIDGITSGTPLKFEAGAHNNVAIIPFCSAYANIVDTDGASSGNIIIGNGKITIGGNAVVFSNTNVTFAQVTATNAGAGNASALIASNSSGQAAIAWVYASAGADSKWWDAGALSATTFQFRAINDAQSVANVWLQVVRSAANISSVTFPSSGIGLGTAGSVVGSVAFNNATSGSITLQPATGALGSAVLTLPAATDQLVGRATTDTMSNKTLSSPVLSGAPVVSGIVEFTGALFTFAGNGQAGVGASATNGGLFGGQGSTSDITLVNKSGTAVLAVPTGTTTLSASLGASTNLLLASTSSYNVVSLNNTAVLASMIGIFGGAGGDSTALYLAAPSIIHFWLGGNVFTFSSTEFQPATDNSIAMGDGTHRFTNYYGTGTHFALNGTATTAGGAATAGLSLGTAGIGVYFGSGAPTISAPQGSLYLRTDGSSGTTRAYINTNASTTWTAINTVA